MTTEVSTVRLDTPYKVIAAQLHEHRVDAVPVVNDNGCVLGVVSAADLLAKVALDGNRGQEGLFPLRHHRELQQAHALVRHGIAQQVRHMEGVVAVRERTAPKND